MDKTLVNVVGVVFKKYGKKYYFDCHDLKLKKNITVIVETERGLQFGTVIKTEDGRALVVTDRFGDGRSNCLDIFMETEQECWEWGRRYVECKVELP